MKRSGQGSARTLKVTSTKVFSSATQLTSKAGSGSTYAAPAQWHYRRGGKPAPGETICDVACGTGGFLLSAHDYIQEHYALDRPQKRFLKEDALRGFDIVDSVVRLRTMKHFSHGIGGETSPFLL